MVAPPPRRRDETTIPAISCKSAPSLSLGFAPLRLCFPLLHSLAITTHARRRGGLSLHFKQHRCGLTTSMYPPLPLAASCCEPHLLFHDRIQLWRVFLWRGSPAPWAPAPSQPSTRLSLQQSLPPALSPLNLNLSASLVPLPVCPFAPSTARIGQSERPLLRCARAVVTAELQAVAKQRQKSGGTAKLGTAMPRVQPRKK